LREDDRRFGAQLKILEESVEEQLMRVDETSPGQSSKSSLLVASS